MTECICRWNEPKELLELWHKDAIAEMCNRQRMETAWMQ